MFFRERRPAHVRTPVVDIQLTLALTRRRTVVTHPYGPLHLPAPRRAPLPRVASARRRGRRIHRRHVPVRNRARRSRTLSTRRRVPLEPRALSHTSRRAPACVFVAVRRLNLSAIPSIYNGGKAGGVWDVRWEYRFIIAVDMDTNCPWSSPLEKYKMFLTFFLVGTYLYFDGFLKKPSSFRWGFFLKIDDTDRKWNFVMIRLNAFKGI